MFEDSKATLLGPNIWMLRKFGMILPENKIGRFFSKLLYLFIGPLFIFTQCIELYVTRSHLDEVFLNLRVLMLSFICCLKGVNFVVWQNDWIEVFNFINAVDIYERECCDSVRNEIIKNYTKYSRQFTNLYWCFVFMTFASTVTQPYIFLMSPSFQKALENGTEAFPHIFSSYFPFDKYQAPFTWVAVGFHTLMGASGASLLATFDAIVIVAIIFFGGRSDLVKEKCKKIFYSGTKTLSDKEILANIAEIHNAHVAVLKYARLLNSLLSPILFMYLIGCSLMICTSAIQLTGSKNPTHMLFLAEYLVFGIAQLFLICWHSNTVLTKFEQLAWGPYESEWYSAGVKHARNIYLLTGQLRRVYIFSAGPFTNLTLPTFITILKGAYSYYTLLRN